MNTQESTKSRSGFLFEILSGWRNFIEVIVIAIFLAFGINLVASGFIIYAQLSSSASIIIGSIVCLGSVFYFITRILGRRSRFRTYEGFFIYNRKLNELISVPKHGFSEDLSRYFEAAFSENKALETIWNREPLGLPFETETRESESKRKTLIRRLSHQPRTYQLIREATEYFVLSRLSTHLTDYFNDERFREENLKTFLRDDVPDVLLRNRFLELFSKPMEERPAFVVESLEKEDEESETVAAYYSGAMYEKFDLVLPKESIIRRVEQNRIDIETKRFVFDLTVRFEGMNTFIPPDFLKHYLSVRKPVQEIMEFLIAVDVQVSFKFGALLSTAGWEYYRWIDSFLGVLDGEFSQSTFFKSIGWNTAITVIKCMTQKSKAKKKKITSSAKDG